MKRTVAIYARVSTEHEAQVSALGNQVQYYDDILRKHPDWELYERYIDEGITGTSIKKRKNFMRMMDDAAAGKFDLIITREVSRFARNIVDTLQQTRVLKRQGIEVFFTDDNIWTMNDEDGELRLSIMATLAQNESKKTSMRVKAGQMVSFKNGVPYGNGNILGYDKIGKEYVINESQADTVRRIFELYESGKGVRQIQFIMEQEGRLTSTGKKTWQCGNISRILRNAFYCGTVVYRKQYIPDYLEQKRKTNHGDVDQVTVEGTHQPIITKEQFRHVQDILDGRVGSVNGGPRKGLKRCGDVWSKKLKCQCGCHMNRANWKCRDGIPQYAYQCYGQMRTGSVNVRKKKGLSIEGICTTKLVPRWKLETMAYVVFEAFWNDKQSVIKIANEMLDSCYESEKDNEILDKKMELEHKLALWDNKYDNLVNMRMAGEIEKDKYDSKREELKKEQDSILDQLKNIGDLTDISDKDYKDKLEVLKCGLENDFNFSTKQIPEEIIDAFVDEIVVCDDCFIWKLNFFPDYGLVMGVDGTKKNPSVSLLESTSKNSEQHRLL